MNPDVQSISPSIPPISTVLSEVILPIPPASEQPFETALSAKHKKKQRKKKITPIVGTTRTGAITRSQSIALSSQSQSSLPHSPSLLATNITAIDHSYDTDTDTTDGSNKQPVSVTSSSTIPSNTDTRSAITTESNSKQSSDTSNSVPSTVPTITTATPSCTPPPVTISRPPPRTFIPNYFDPNIPAIGIETSLTDEQQKLLTCYLQPLTVSNALDDPYVVWEMSGICSYCHYRPADDRPEFHFSCPICPVCLKQIYNNTQDKRIKDELLVPIIFYTKEYKRHVNRYVKQLQLTNIAQLENKWRMLFGISNIPPTLPAFQYIDHPDYEQLILSPVPATPPSPPSSMPSPALLFFSDYAVELVPEQIKHKYRLRQLYTTHAGTA